LDFLKKIIESVPDHLKSGTLKSKQPTNVQYVGKEYWLVLHSQNLSVEDENAEGDGPAPLERGHKKKGVGLRLRKKPRCPYT
jgi:hypothetical protein